MPSLALHAAFGMAAQRWLKWLYVPVALGSHAALDASVVYHNYPGAWGIPPVVVSVAVSYLAIKRKLWLGAGLAVLADIEIVIKGIMGTPYLPVWDYWFHALQRYWPRWNWHGLYGAWWGVPAEAGLLLLLLWLSLKRKKEVL